MSDPPAERHPSAAPRALRADGGEDEPIRVAVVDDEPGLRRSLARILAGRNFVVETADDGQAGLELFQRFLPDVALVDMRMPVMDGLELLRRSKASGADVEIIMMTAYADMETAVSAVKLGAYHFLTKPFPSNDAVVLTCAKAAEHRRLLARAKRLEQRLEAQEQFGEFIGGSAKMLAVYKLIHGVAHATSTVLILGESGTGKELVARAIHQQSPRVNKPFVAVNCAAIPKELVESELFGHVRGAFTGAQTARAGLFESANGGTIFLDEIGDLPLAAQVKLLRTLQEGEVKRVGSDDTRIVDVRVLAATNVDLQTKIASGAFRRDLFYRLNVIAIGLPPLRQRGDDVSVLAYHFVQKYARRMQRDVKRISPPAMAVLQAYNWPGNVRELEHAIEHAVVLAQTDSITVADLPFGKDEDTWGEAPTTTMNAPPASLHSALVSPPYSPAASPAPSAVAAPAPAPSSAAASADRAATSSSGQIDKSDKSDGDDGELASFEGFETSGLTLGPELLALPYGDAKKRALETFDRAYVGELLKRTGGNLSEAARQAGLDRSNFRRIVRKAK